MKKILSLFALLSLVFLPCAMQASGNKTAAFWQYEVSGTTRTSDTCPIPKDLVASDILFNSANLSWTGNNDSYSVRHKPANVYLFEDFDDGDWPTGWSSQSLVGSSSWTVDAGDKTAYTTGFTGAHNALIQHVNMGYETMLITPVMNLDGANNATLSFWFLNRIWYEDIDDLFVYYRSNGGSWQLLWSSTENHEIWTNVNILLPELSDNIQIAFKMKDDWGYGIAIDNVVVYEALSSNWQTLAGINSTSVSLSDLLSSHDQVCQVKGHCGYDESEWGAFYAFTTGVCPTPANLTASDITTHSVTLSWQAETDECDVMIGETLIEHVSGNTLDYPFLMSGSTYPVKVRASCSLSDHSSWSDVINVTTLPCSSLISVGIKGDTSVCSGGYTILSAFSNVEGSYIWSTGSTSEQILATPGTYSLTVTSGDVSLSTSVTVTTKAKTYTSASHTICQDELPYVWNGQTFTNSGTKVATLVGSNGCDSIVTMTLTVNPVYDTTLEVVLQPFEPYVFLGDTLSEVGTYSHTLQSIHGCDSVINLLLDVDCSASSIPYFYDFEIQSPYLCWTPFGATTFSNYTDQNHTPGGLYSLKFWNNYSNIVMLPEFEQEANTLELSFWTRPETIYNDNCGSFSVGYLTDPSDSSTFVPVNTYHYYEWSDKQFEKKTEYFHFAPPGSRIAFRHTPNKSSWYWFVDDLTVRAAPPCIRPISLSATNITAHSATLNWTPRGSESAWNLYYKMVSDTLFTEVTGITSNHYTLDGLESGYGYDISVKAVCGDEEISDFSDTCTFYTECVPITEFPWTEDFEDREGVIYHFSSANNLPHCFDYINNYDDIYSTQYPLVISSAGNHSVWFYSYYNAYYETQDQYLILPVMENLSGLKLTFNSKQNDYYESTYLHIGVMEEDTFVEIDSVFPTTNYNFESHTVYLDSYQGSGNRIAIKMNASTSGIFQIQLDNILVEEIPSCVDPYDITVSDVTDHSAVVNWKVHNSATQWEIHYKSSNESGYTTVTTSAKPITLQGLQRSTLYTLFVKSICGDADTSIASTSITFNTNCGVITEFPWTEDFESKPLNNFNDSCWVNERIVDGTGSGNLYIFRVNGSDIGGNSSRKLYLPDMKSGSITKLVLPEMFIPGDAGYQFSIDVYRNAPSTSTAPEGIRVFASPNGEIEGATELGFLYRNYAMTDSGVVTSENKLGWYTYEFQIPFSGTCYIILQGESFYGNSTFTDNYKVELSPTCLKPLGVVASDITPQSVNLTWITQNDESEWSICYKKSTSTTFTEITGVTENPYLLQGLEPLATYDLYVKAVCNAGDTSNPSSTISFTMPCGIEPLPFTYDFEEQDPYNKCWITLSGKTVFGASYNHTPGGSSGIRFYQSLNTIVVLPELETTGAPLQITFWSKPENNTYSSCGTFSVGYITDLTDTSTFVAVATYSYDEWSSNIFLENSEYLVGMPSGARIAFRHTPTSSSYYWYLDDVEVKETNLCIPPFNLHADDISQHSANLHWTARSNETAWNIYYRSLSDTTFTEIAGVTEIPYLLSGLEPAKSYEFYVKGVCSESDTSNPSRSAFFITECEHINTYPWSENFDDPGKFPQYSGTHFLPICWDFINNSSSSSYSRYPMILENTSLAYSGMNCLVFKSVYYNNDSSYDPQDQYAILPVMENINTLRLRAFVARNSSSDSYNGDFKVGVMEGDQFVEVQSLSATSTNNQPFTVYFNTYNGPGNRIAIKVDAAYSDSISPFYRYIYIDNITVESIPGCIPPWELTTSDITTESAVLDWSTRSEEMSWYVHYKKALEPDYTVVPVTSKPYTLSGLDNSTTYQFYVTAFCDANGESEPSEVCTFSTDCDTIRTFPWTENFDGIIGSSSGSKNILPLCWDYINTSIDNYVKGYPNVYNSSSSSRSGINHLRFYSDFASPSVSTSSIYDPQDEYAILPAMSNINTLRINLFARAYSSTSNSYDATFHVGIMEDSGFVNIATFTPTSTVYTLYTVNFDTYQGDGSRIAIKADAAYSPTLNYAYRSVFIDDITVEEIPNCQEPTSLTAENVTSSSANISWTALNGETLWNIYYKKLDDDAFTEIPAVTTNPYLLTGLEGNTTYKFFVEAVCDDSHISSQLSIGSFSTPCDIIPIPYAYDFENSNPFKCWTIPTGTSDRTSSYNNTPGGTYCLRSKGSFSNFIVLPEFEEEISSLHLSYWCRPEMNNNRCGSLLVGYLTDVNDTSSFVAVNSYSYSEWSNIVFLQKSATFEDAPAGSRIAFLQRANADNYYWFVDDIDIQLISTCSAPTNLEVSAITTQSVQLSWTANDGDSVWNIYYKKSTDTAYTVVPGITSNPYTLTGLDNSSNYQIRLTAICEETNESYSSEIITFSTECSTINSFPWTEDFESFIPNLTSSENIILPICWDYINQCTYSSYAEYPTINDYAYNPHSGEQCLEFYSYYSEGSNLYDPQDQYAILPAMDNLSALRMTFYAAPYDIGDYYDASFKVGVMEGDNFIEIQSISPSSEEYQKYLVYFNNYHGTGNRIAIKIDAAHSNTVNYFYRRLYIDDITVELIPSCPEPIYPSVNGTSYNTADLSWTGFSDLNNIRYRTTDTVFSQLNESFENGLEQWTPVLNQGSTGISHTYYHTGNCAFAFYNGSITDQYLISPVLTDMGDDSRMVFYCRSYNALTFRIGTSTTNSNISAFTFGDTITTNEDQWICDTFDIPTGTKYISFKYLAGSSNNLYLDDIIIGNFREAGEWQTVTADSGSHTLTGLTSGTVYEADIQSVCGAEETSIWSDRLRFSTTPGIIPSYVNIEGPVNVCVGDTFFLNANSDVAGTYTWSNGMIGEQISVGAGTYTVTVTSVSNDTLSETVTVTEWPTFNTPLTAEICEGGSYDFFGETITNAGTYTHHLQTINGCDSVFTLTLTLKPTFSAVDEMTICPSELPYTWNGASFSEAGTQTVILEAANGCDSTVVMTLNVYPTYNITDTKSVCLNELPYTWNGVIFHTAGTQTVTLQTVDGCDSVVTMTLAVNPTYNVTDSRAICESELPYSWNGVTFTATGTQSVTLQSIHGCDSTVVMTLHVYPTYHITDTKSVCPNELPYTWNGVIFHTADTQTVTSQTVDGCDSVVTMILSVNQTYVSTDNHSICQNELPYTWNGVTFTAAGSQIVTLQSIDGCDSTVIMILAVRPTWNTTDIRSICESELPYSWNGVSFTEAGTQSVTLQTTEGCDSVVTMTLIVNPTFSVSDSRSICESELPYSWNGVSFTEADTRSATLQTTEGCDSVVTMTLIVNPTFTISDSRIICESELPYSWNGVSFTEAGTQSVTLQTTEGCDSVVTMTLTVNPTFSVSDTRIICESELPYSWNGVSFTEAGTQSVTLQTTEGCDSVVTMTLAVNPTFSVSDTRSICESELPYSWNGVAFTEASTQSVTLQTTEGCDSVVTMTLTVNPTFTVSDSRSICESELPYSWNGVAFTEAGTQSVTLQTTEGCDSVVTMTLNVNPTFSISDTRSICESELPYSWNGVSFTEAGTQSVTLQTTEGCDSVVTMTLNVNPTFSVSDSRSICESELPYSWNGVAFTEAGTQSVTLQTTEGCDSVVTMTLNVNPTFSVSDTRSICENELPYSWNGVAFNEAGTQSVTLQTTEGCDSVVTMTLNVNYSTASEFTIETADSCYNWNGQLYCSSGDYVQTLTSASGCDSVVTLHLTTGVGVDEYEVSVVYLAPNPTRGICRIFGLEQDPVSVDIYDMNGALVKQDTKREIDVTALPTGIYIVKVYTGDRHIHLKLFKR